MGRQRPIQVAPAANINNHVLAGYNVTPNIKHPVANREHFVKDPASHFTKDVTQNLEGERDAASLNPNDTAPVTAPTSSGTTTRVFSGATTQMNPTNDPVKEEILNGGLSYYLEGNRLTGLAKDGDNGKMYSSYNKPPVSPFHPFTRLNSPTNIIAADQAIFNTYNRTKLPVADIEWRKGFRHIFITRPELYLTYQDKGIFGLCDQCAHDEDFASAYLRMPHIIKLLSPWYVSGSFPKNSLEGMNWNYLFSNRVNGMTVSPTTMSINENVSKSIEGYTVTPAMHVETRQGSTLDLTFTDTKNLEIFETARLWMLYMYKRKKGIFVPPYNGYAKTNSFMKTPGGQPKALEATNYTRMHPYDRAIEYCASLYDIVTNETGTKILYWCKYYGIYPTSVTPSLNNDANAPITSASTSITFKYHYRLENANRSLVEFNHDAGLTDAIGRIKEDAVNMSFPFLLRQDGMDNDAMNHYLPHYVGAAGMFTGSPFIIMKRTQRDPLDDATMIMTPQLMFMPTNSLDYDGQFNVGIVNDKIDKDTTSYVIGYPKYQSTT